MGLASFSTEEQPNIVRFVQYFSLHPTWYAMRVPHRRKFSVHFFCGFRVRCTMYQNLMTIFILIIYKNFHYIFGRVVRAPPVRQIASEECRWCFSTPHTTCFIHCCRRAAGKTSQTRVAVKRKVKRVGKQEKKKVTICKLHRAHESHPSFWGCS